LFGASIFTVLRELSVSYLIYTFIEPLFFSTFSPPWGVQKDFDEYALGMGISR
jgi:hypothetical protein